MRGNLPHDLRQGKVLCRQDMLDRGLLTGQFQPRFGGQESLVNQAQSQINQSNGLLQSLLLPRLCSTYSNATV